MVLLSPAGFPGGASSKEPACPCKRYKSHRLDPWVRKIPQRRAWQPTPVFLPGESPWRISMDRGAWWATVHRVAELDATEQLSTHACIPCTLRLLFWILCPARICEKRGHRASCGYLSWKWSMYFDCISLARTQTYGQL